MAASEYLQLGRDAATRGGQLAGKVMWLYAGMYGLEAGTGDMGRSVAYGDLKQLRAETWREADSVGVGGHLDGATDEEWRAWIEGRMAALRLRLSVLAGTASAAEEAALSDWLSDVDGGSDLGGGVGGDGLGAEFVAQLLERELSGLSRLAVIAERKARRAEGPWAGEAIWLAGSRRGRRSGESPEEFRERHALRCENRAYMLLVASLLTQRYGGGVPFDQKLCRGLAGQYLAQVGEWRGEKASNARFRARWQEWLRVARAELSTQPGSVSSPPFESVRAAARSFCWESDVLDWIEFCDGLSEILVGRAAGVMSRESSFLSRRLSEWRQQMGPAVVEADWSARKVEG